MIRYKGINHLAMATRDMDATIRFWRDLLGMRLVAGLGRPGYRHYFFEISHHDMIAFFEWPHVDKIEEKDHGVPVRGPFVFDHVSFEVESDDDLRTLMDKLEASQSRMSRHMKVLREAGFTESDRRGKWVYHRLVPERLEQVQVALSPGLAAEV